MRTLIAARALLLAVVFAPLTPVTPLQAQTHASAIVLGVGLPAGTLAHAQNPGLSVGWSHALTTPRVDSLTGFTVGLRSEWQDFPAQGPTGRSGDVLTAALTLSRRIHRDYPPDFYIIGTAGPTLFRNPASAGSTGWRTSVATSVGFGIFTDQRGSSLEARLVSTPFLPDGYALIPIALVFTW